MPAAPGPVHDEPVYWFVILDQALEKGDLETESQAKRELRRLGVDVKYRTRPAGQIQKEVAHVV